MRSEKVRQVLGTEISLTFSSTGPSLSELSGGHSKVELSSYFALARKDVSISLAFILILIALQVIDIVAGLIKAFVKKEICSTASWIGSAKKAGVLLAVSIFALLDPIIPNFVINLGRMLHLPGMEGVSFTFTLTSVAAAYFVLQESVSVIEKLAIIGVKLPPGLVKKFKKVQRYVDEKFDEESAQSSTKE
jgi:toxin secretion/phage lysis holin